MQKAVIIIPARFQSSRFPGKSLQLIDEYNVIQTVYLRAMEVSNADRVVVATDDPRIQESIEALGGTAVITNANHVNGTSRIAEVASSLEEYDFVINVQGDEPFVDPLAVAEVIAQLNKGNDDIVTLMKRCHGDELNNRNVVKVVNSEGLAIKFFRMSEVDDINSETIFKHIGVYGFKRRALLDLASLPPTKLEQELELEQLRWLEHGYNIALVETSSESIGIDVPEDLEKARIFAKSLTL